MKRYTSIQSIKLECADSGFVCGIAKEGGGEELAGLELPEIPTLQLLTLPPL